MINKVDYEYMLKKAHDIKIKPQFFQQLKEMVLPLYGDKMREQKFKLWMEFQKVYEWPQLYNEEKYWLAFLMCVNYKKIWDDKSENWIEFSMLNEDKMSNMAFCSGFLLF